MTDELGDRMKRYEDASRFYLPERMPVILRLDGKAFHTYTRGCVRPYDPKLMMVMDEVTRHLCKNVQNCVMAYTQSDEISLLLVNYKTVDTNSWFDNNLSKMVSISASLASVNLTLQSDLLFGEHRQALFDCRAFVMPERDVENYFIWRQKDWFRNSIQMLAQSLYSQKQLQGKKSADLHEMCFQKGHNWANLSSHIKNGRICIKEVYREYLKPRPVTHPYEDAPDGAVLDGWERVGDTWMPPPGSEPALRSRWFIPAETPIFTEAAGREAIRNLMKPETESDSRSDR